MIYFKKTILSLKHLEVLHKTFIEKNNFTNEQDWLFYKENLDKLNELLSKVRLHDQLYDKKGRQMILADIIEYIFFARGYYSALKGKDRIQDFIRIILRIVNLLMSYETITVDDNLRKRFFV